MRFGQISQIVQIWAFFRIRVCVYKNRNARARKESKLIGYSEKKKEALGLLL